VIKATEEGEIECSAFIWDRIIGNCFLMNISSEQLKLKEPSKAGYSLWWSHQHRPIRLVSDRINEFKTETDPKYKLIDTDADRFDHIEVNAEEIKQGNGETTDVSVAFSSDSDVTNDLYGYQIYMFGWIYDLVTKSVIFPGHSIAGAEQKPGVVKHNSETRNRLKESVT